jgi:hypothetical protein
MTASKVDSRKSTIDLISGKLVKTCFNGVAFWPPVFIILPLPGHV